MNTGETADAATGGEPAGLAGPPVYLDYNATTPVDPQVVEAMLPYFGAHFGNPSSAHSYGQRPRAALARARAQVAALIGAAPAEILFTGSGSEADATAIRGVVTMAVRGGVGRPHVVTQATEHPAVLAACGYVRDHHGAEVTVLGVDARGLVDPRELAAALRPETVLVSIMHANNETGVLQPIAELAGITRGHGALFHTDAAQAVGKIPVDVSGLGVDLLTLVGHKFYAPKGVGALYIREGVALEALIGGGGQEQGRRAGTENVPYTVALGAAAELAMADLAAGSADRLAGLRDRLQRELQMRLPGRMHTNGSDAPRLPQTLNISIDGTRGHAVLAACPDLAASTGSACHAGEHRPSPVLAAMGVDEERGLAALRLSLGRWSTEADVLTAAKAIAEAAG
ncbi:cysteine desulfurase [Arthrobacter sp. I2-34]|uniref:Cysteine desulfurase n=1 Tax=Arthrobacter hankyongi TaxID=2904801 RepID=A0ABS9L8T9_9MICC|nr:cysteine desulfurase family protein [Arthrobacter hankyongi]MCG2623082.1 cysteine desulfurase [Arthrobacter hankyongi]